jgi:hypothetical protein
MQKSIASRNDFPIELTLHQFPASLVIEFAEKIVRPYFDGNLNAAIKDLIHKALAEQEFVFSRITHGRNSAEA